MKWVIIGVAGTAFVLGAPGYVGAARFLGPTPYLGYPDSPFFDQVFDGYFHLEDFEDNTLNTPGVTASFGYPVEPGTYIDSVDADDGAVDGFGTAGHSFYSSAAGAVTFTFQEATLTGLPDHAGIVWTDIGTGGGYYGNVSFEAFDQVGASLGVHGPFPVGDGSDLGETGEDRFLGVVNPGGILKFTISMDSYDWEVDHLQYGLTIPEPLLGDMNGDWDVDDLDVVPFLDHLLAGPFHRAADMNQDDILDGLDVAGFVAAVQATGGAQVVPEPGTVWLTAIGLLGLVTCGWRRRKHTT